ncbi:hypothetical protein [Larkinella soli]|uniref:hypothetical protein n=1 Tax=Larkinella soli TaxID=1770527 RepID=UPI000FFB7FE1|nr:hypothetical protein [Larkinella soli]
MNKTETNVFVVHFSRRELLRKTHPNLADDPADAGVSFQLMREIDSVVKDIENARTLSRQGAEILSISQGCYSLGDDVIFSFTILYQPKPGSAARNEV